MAAAAPKKTPVTGPAKRDRVTVVSLLIGTGIALAASKTKAAPFVVAVLSAALVYQLLNL